MGDATHKKPPPTDEEEGVTDAFREEVRQALDINARANRLRRHKKGDPGYLISNRAELAKAIGTDKTMVNKIIGGKREDTKVELVHRSAFVGRIRAVLQLAAVTTIKASIDRAPVYRWLDSLPDGVFEAYRQEYEREQKRRR